MKSKIQKINELSFLSAILCILVIFIHISSQGIEQLSKSSLQYAILFFLWRFSQFVVQGFIFLSALKISMKNKDKHFSISEYKRFIKNRIFIIFLPYVLWVFIYYAVFCFAGYFKFNIFEYLRFVFIGDLSAQFYFIIIIMQFYLFMPLWISIVKRIKPSIGLAFSFIITFLFIYYFWDFLFLISKGEIDFLYNDRILTSYLFYFISGCYAGLYYQSFKKAIIKNIKIIAAMFFAVLILNTKISYNQFLGIKVYWGFELIHIIYCSFAILFWIYICIQLANYKNIFTNLLDIINEGSYYTYLSHCLIIIVLGWIFKKVGITSLRDMLILKVIAVYGLSICSSHVYLILKKKFLGVKQDRLKTPV